MIETEDAYRRTRQAVFHIEMAMRHRTEERESYGPHFAMVASSEVKMILKLRAKTDAYIGLTAYLNEFGIPKDETAEENGTTPTADHGKIETEEAYRRTREALLNIEFALASKVRKREKYGPHFADVARGEVEMILKLRAEMDAYIGLTAYLEEFGVPTDDAPAANGTTPTAPALAATT